VGEENTITTLLKQPGKTMVLLPEPYRSTLPPEPEGLIPVMKQYGYVLLSNQPKVTIRHSLRDDDAVTLRWLSDKFKKRASDVRRACQNRCEELVPMRKEKGIEKIWCPQRD
jgi:hypothetical protein